jgi:superfamily II RNA helicase
MCIDFYMYNMATVLCPSTCDPALGYPPADPALSYTFPLDPFQQHAILAIHREDNVLVTAKTGSGKTLVGEYQIAYSLRKGGRVFYTTPIKSLTNQKYADLKKLFPGHSVGIMTGDIKSAPEADIVIMTTEILRNLLFKHTTATAHVGTAGQLTLDGLDAVVFDEAHYVNDPDRGHVWEECMILLPPAVKLILLSATIDSARAFAEWLARARHRPIVLLQTTHRVVPLVHGVFDPTTPADALPLVPLKAGDEAPFDADAYRGWLRGGQARARAADEWAARVRAAAADGSSIAGAGGKVRVHSFTHQLNQCVDVLKTRDLLPALFFQFSRRECETYASQLQHTLLDGAETAALKHILKFHLHRYEETLRHLPQYHTLLPLLERGIAFHHSGVLPLLKEVIELLFSRGYIKVLFCTETFAVGLNMPTRTVVFLDMKKPAEGGFRPLRADEYIQMAGRAGRRGKDTRGIVLYLPARVPVDVGDMRQSLSGALPSLQSRLRFHYDFVLKALLRGGGAEGNLWTSITDASYWAAQRAEHRVTLEKELAVLRARVETTAQDPALRAELEKKAELEAAVRANVNAARQRAQAALDRWKERHMGQKWTQAAAEYAAWTNTRAAAAALEEQLAVEENPVDRAVDALCAALREWGAVVPASASAPAAAPVLTPFGVIATECNEGNPLLLAKLYTSGLLAEASAAEIVGTLGAFIVEKEALDASRHPNTLKHPVSDRVKETLLQMEEWSQMGVVVDKRYDIPSPDTFWCLSTFWVEIATDWFSGTLSAAELVDKYGIYEGNLMRGLLKVAALLQEWTAIATYKGDVGMLERLRGADTQLLRDIAQPESLYLRL